MLCRFARGGNQGQGQDEGCAAGGGMLDVEASLGGGGKGSRQGQAQAQAMLARFGGKEGFEQVLARFGVNAVAVVAHLQTVLVALQLAFQPQLRLRLRGHRVKGVADQVDQNLLQAGLVDGQLVRVRSRVGTIEVEVAASDEMMAGVVSLPHGWGHARPGVQMAIASAQPGASANDLTDERQLDALSGNAALNGVPVQVAAA